MAPNEKTTEVVNDLIRINNDRVEGYERAAKETNTKDADLRSLFTDLANQSRKFASDLGRHVTRTGEEPADGTTFSGKIYRAWMDVKATFTGSDRKSILASCEFGEDAAQKAYETALKSDAELPTDVRQVIADQKQDLDREHDRIRNMRDNQPK
jgi:uncharacterized protein (TIGR02284 family)